MSNNTPGTVSFTVTTLPAGGNYSPRHVLAIWVEKDGTFVKTRKAMANQRKQYLYKWAASSGYNVVDAITGPTLTSHQTHTIAWDCTDVNGNVVPDGDYSMIIEFTDKHAQGPFYEIVFNKGDEPFAIMPPNQQYIINMSLTYTPEIVVVADFSANVSQACMGDEVIFTDLSSGASSWDWQFGEGANPASATSQGPHSVSYTTSGSKSISLTINGSVNITKTGYISIDPLPMAGFEYEQDGNEIHFINASQNATTYLWDFGDGNSSTEINPQHVFAQNGTYNVVLQASNSLCGDDSYGELITINSVSVEHIQGVDFKLYPNPTSGKLFLSHESISSIEEIVLYNLQGIQVYHFTPGSMENQHVMDLSFLSLTPGVYFLKVSSADRNHIEKVIVK